jgi:hypothetical protein
MRMKSIISAVILSLGITGSVFAQAAAPAAAPAPKTIVNLDCCK